MVDTRNKIKSQTIVGSSSDNNQVSNVKIDTIGKDAAVDEKDPKKSPSLHNAIFELGT